MIKAYQHYYRRVYDCSSYVVKYIIYNHLLHVYETDCSGSSLFRFIRYIFVVKCFADSN